MIEVTIESIRVSLMSQARVVILKDLDSDRYLPIWIGQYEADAIMATLQEIEVVRPLTHDLLKNMIIAMGGKVERVVVNDLRNDVFYARIIMQAHDQHLEIDSRPSDALALAVRLHVPIFIDPMVMERAAVQPDQEMAAEEEKPPEKLDAFKDFVDTLNLEDLEDSDDETDEAQTPG